MAFALLVLVILFFVYTLREAWPAFRVNGLGFFGYDRGNPLDDQLFRSNPSAAAMPSPKLNAWAGIVATLLCTGGALVVGLPFSLLCAVFIAVVAPPPIVRVMEPVVRLLAGVPSVIFGLVGLLLVAPFLDAHLLSDRTKDLYAPAVPLSGTSLLAGILVLTLMIAPIMIAVFVDALRAVPNAWKEGSLALGVDDWRTTVRVSIPFITPAIVAGTVLAAGRAIGEAIALSLVTGSLAWIPNPLDGFTALLEPVHPLGALIVDNSEGIPSNPLTTNLFAFASILLVSAVAFSLIARVALLPGRRMRG